MMDKMVKEFRIQRKDSTAQESKANTPLDSQPFDTNLFITENSLIITLSHITII